MHGQIDGWSRQGEESCCPTGSRAKSNFVMLVMRPARVDAVFPRDQ